MNIYKFIYNIYKILEWLHFYEVDDGVANPILRSLSLKLDYGTASNVLLPMDYNHIVSALKIAV